MVKKFKLSDTNLESTRHNILLKKTSSKKKTQETSSKTFIKYVFELVEALHSKKLSLSRYRNNSVFISHITTVDVTLLLTIETIETF